MYVIIANILIILCSGKQIIVILSDTPIKSHITSMQIVLAII